MGNLNLDGLFADEPLHRKRDARVVSCFRKPDKHSKQPTFRRWLAKNWPNVVAVLFWTVLYPSLFIWVVWREAVQQ